MAARPRRKPTSGKTEDKEKRPASPWDRLSITSLEADLAYFHARLEWIGKPETINQKAQRDTFQALIPAVGKILNRLKHKTPIKG